MLLLSDTGKLIIEVGIFAVGTYVILRFLRETRGSGVIRGLTLALVLGVLVFVTLIGFLKLDKLEMVFQAVIQSMAIGLIIVFQPEIRSAIVRLGQANLFGRFLKREVQVVPRLIRSVARLSRDHIGALMAIERQNPLASLAETGINIDAELNSYLIESVFYPGNSLHDGAIVIRNDRVVAASCLLPLSQRRGDRYCPGWPRSSPASSPPGRCGVSDPHRPQGPLRVLWSRRIRCRPHPPG